jgi:dihydropteroate synthase
VRPETWAGPAGLLAICLAAAPAALAAEGLVPDTLAVDPGIGFGKTLEHNLRLLNLKTIEPSLEEAFIKLIGGGV